MSPVIATATMSVMVAVAPVHEEMHADAGQQRQQERHNAKCVGAVFEPQIEGCRDEKDGQGKACRATPKTSPVIGSGAYRGTPSFWVDVFPAA